MTMRHFAVMIQMLDYLRIIMLQKQTQIFEVKVQIIEVQGSKVTHLDVFLKSRQTPTLEEWILTTLR